MKKKTSYSVHRLYVLADVRTIIAEQTASPANDPLTWPQFRLFAAPFSAPETQKG